MPVISLHTLGPVDVRVDGAPPPPDLLWSKHLALLVHLALAGGRGRSRDQLIGLLWADKPDASARHSLNEAVRVIRRAAGDDAIRTVTGYRSVGKGVVDCDAARFDAYARAGRWTEAAALVHGDFLDGFVVPGAPEFENWVAVERLARRGRSVEALLRASDALSSAGDIEGARASSRRALALDPLADAAVRSAMRVEALAGDRGAALRQFERFAERLRGELTSEPDAETSALAERLRRAQLTQTREPPPAADAARRGPLVARAEELRALLRCWETVRSARLSALMIIEGNAGMGRSRLADELARRAALDGATVATVRAVEGDAATPWSGIYALARGGLLDAPGLAGASPAALGALAGAVPEWAERFPHIPAQSGAPARALLEVLRVTSEERPVLVVVDGAHCLDSDSLLALAPILRDLADRPCAIVLSTTPHPGRDEIDLMRTRIGRDLNGAVVGLRPLDYAATRELAAWALPAIDSERLDRVARRVLHDSAGVPLLAFELVHAVAHGLELDPARSWPAPFRTLEATLPGDLPDAVVAAIRIAYRRLGPDAQAILGAAAALGGRVSAEEAARGAGLDAAAGSAALDTVEWDRWLVSEPRGYAFTAGIVREVIARDMLTAGQRRRILDRVGRGPA